MNNKLISKKKPSFKINKVLDDYLASYRRKIVIPIFYEDLKRFSGSVSVYNNKEIDTLWVRVFYSDFEKECGVLDKNSLVGAGYFQLYQYDSSKLCKRTYTAGWVDWEFKEQFKYLKQIKNGVYFNTYSSRFCKQHCTISVFRDMSIFRCF